MSVESMNYRRQRAIGKRAEKALTSYGCLLIITTVEIDVSYRDRLPYNVSETTRRRRLHDNASSYMFRYVLCLEYLQLTSLTGMFRAKPDAHR